MIKTKMLQVTNGKLNMYSFDFSMADINAFFYYNIFIKPKIKYAWIILDKYTKQENALLIINGYIIF